MHNQPRVTAYCELLVQDCTFTGSTDPGYSAGNDGGGMHVQGEVRVKDSEFSTFRAVGPGGGIQMLSGTLDLDTVIFSGCRGSMGGGIDASGDVTLKVDQCAFGSCHANSGDGGGMRVDGTHLTLTDTTFGSCSAHDGGALKVELSDPSAIMDCQTNSNWASGDGGAVHASGQITISGTGTVVNNNATGSGGAMYLADGVELSGWHFSLNGAGVSGGAVCLAGSDCSILGKGLMFFSSNVSEGDGGAVSCSGTGQVIDGIEFRENDASAGGAISVGPGTAWISGCLVEDNFANQGGGLYAIGSTTLNLNNITFHKNQAQVGGGAYARSTGLEVTQCVFDENLVGDQAGGAYLLNCSGFIRNSFVTRHDSPNEAGGLQMLGCTLLIEDCEILFNTAQTAGGGAFAEISSLLFIRGRIEHNIAMTQGGGLFAEDTQCSMVNGVVADNGAITGGGLRFIDEEVKLIEMEISENIAQWGGGVACLGSDLTIEDSVFLNNEAQEDGGGLLLGSSAQLNCMNSVFNTNTAWQRGGNCFFMSAQATLIDTDLLGGFASIVGGGIGAIASPVEIIGCVISGNASGGGGGIYSVGYVELFLLDVTVQSNVSGSYGGGVFIGGTTAIRADRVIWRDNNLTVDATGNGSALFGGQKVIISNSLFAGNGIPYALFTSGELQLASSTVADNAGTIFCSSSETRSVTNSIVWDNSGAPPTGVEIDYSDIEGGSPGTGNINVDPLFVDPDLLDYSLREASPCLDAGNQALLLVDALDADEDFDLSEHTPLDLIGDDRVMSADVDMGAYEYPGDVPPSCDCDLNGDGVVNMLDLLVLIGGWGSAAGDVNGDGTTNILDLVILIGAWGPC